MEENFETLFKANENRIYFQMKRLGIPFTLYDEFYAEGIVALWQAYKRYDSVKGAFGTYMNYQIRFRLLELIRKKVRDEKIAEKAFYDGKIQIDNGNRAKSTGISIVDIDGITLENEAFWAVVKKELTEKQWKWVHYFVIANLTVKEVMEIEDVSQEAVKGWAKEVRRKLRHEHVRRQLMELI